ncbi:MAG: hypothetical protein R2821_13280 [Flavobacteriaceae bacterium]|jgi:hypothetical protein|nr:hypothetical protein [Flavobacteriaceae bacterium]MCB0486001.1 hypothetical protein [Flavobacteriaceae bacterium]
MLNDLTPKIIESSEVIDEMISQYFANRLGVKDPKTINALGKDGKLTFNQKIELFCDIIPLSKIDKSKFKVFTKINNEILLMDQENSKDLDSLDSFTCYTPFLLNTYLESDDLISVKEKLHQSINLLIEDIKEITRLQINKPQVYYNKKVGIILPQ